MHILFIIFTKFNRKKYKYGSIKPHIYAQLIFNKSFKTVQWGLSTTDAGTTGYPHAKQ